jgi:hypothetical protein
MLYSTRYCSPSKSLWAKKCRSINQKPRSSIESITVFIYNKVLSAYIGHKMRNKTRDIHRRFIQSELVYTETGYSSSFNNRDGIYCSTQMGKRCSLSQTVDDGIRGRIHTNTMDSQRYCRKTIKNLIIPQTDPPYRILLPLSTTGSYQWESENLPDNRACEPT